MELRTTTHAPVAHASHVDTALSIDQVKNAIQSTETRPPDQLPLVIPAQTSTTAATVDWLSGFWKGPVARPVPPPPLQQPLPTTSPPLTDAPKKRKPSASVFAPPPQPPQKKKKKKKSSTTSTKKSTTAAAAATALGTAPTKKKPPRPIKPKTSVFGIQHRRHRVALPPQTEFQLPLSSSSSVKVEPSSQPRESTEEDVPHSYVVERQDPIIQTYVESNPVVVNDPTLPRAVQVAMRRHIQARSQDYSHALIPRHMNNGSVQPTDPDMGLPHRRFEDRGFDGLTDHEYQALVKTRLDQLEEGQPSVLPNEMIMKLMNPLRIVEAEIQLGLLHGLLQTDHRLPKPTHTWALTDLYRNTLLNPTPDNDFNYLRRFSLFS